VQEVQVSQAGTALLLARLQFAFTVSFHFIFPSFTIGLASYLAVLEGLWLKSGDDRFLNLFRYWLKIFAMVFAMGVVSGIVLSYQFGTNWSAFADRAGPIVGPLMAYEVLSAFFLEGGFLGIMLFGLARVGKGLHFFATCMVAAGTLLSAFWILAANSWMQTPGGYAVNVHGQFVPAGSWIPVIFTASFPYRLVHTVIAAYLTTALVVGGAAAWHLLRRRDTPEVRTMFSMAMWMAALVAPVQIFAGDQHGLNTEAHQPPKVMAMEGHYDSYPDGAPLILFGIPDSRAATVHSAVKIPHLSSLILRHSWNAPVAGLTTVPRDRWPPVGIVFWSFRIMVGLAFLMLGLGLLSLWVRWRGRLYDYRSLHRFALLMAPSGFLAVIAGWVTTEVGRQPFVVYGLMRTSEGVAPVGAPGVAGSLVAFALVYCVVFGAGIWYILHLMAQPPHAREGGLSAEPIRTAGITPSPSLGRRPDARADREAR
jgi:cytochrome d ubiquinol oxidase subunit I